MKIINLFKKDINRNIQGVIKIGQDSDYVIKNELEEYVVTSELKKHFDVFFENYKDAIYTPTDKIGVWISGFFGSGKSHFLKILSYLLSSSFYQGALAVDYFINKISDEKLLKNMREASLVSADVILFNIDSKADSDSNNNKDTIVKVFMKVFNEMEGYCASMPWIAELERRMNKDGIYEDFKEKFKELSGMDWTEGRESYYFEEDSIIGALTQTTKMTEDAARSFYNRAESEYSLSIEEFARKVNEYIKAKGDNHHVIFLCDEIGQYIGNDGNLMLNLQTLVENLGSLCKGKAWVIATSQQDIDSITKVSRDNFSKIIGRFDTRLSLSSANVGEVIKKRLLEKTDVAKEKLKLLYADTSAIIKNLLTFSQDTPEKKLYKDEEEFIDVYPFITYQFNLLQAAFTGIRTHGASGKHLSEGERSLLSAFQEAAMKFENHDDGILIPFQAFFKTIESFLDVGIIVVITHAEENQNLIPFDIEVLKVLFMIKYVEILPANIENISTIMIESIYQDKIETKKRIDESLRRLEKERLIIKNGDEYIFLTNEEQDVNREIREIKIDTSDMIDKIGEEIFSILFGTNKKYRYNDRYDFSFNTLVDDKARGIQKEELGVNVVTPLYASGSDISTQELLSMSIRQQNIIVDMPEDYSYFDELEQALQIDQYMRKNAGKSSLQSIAEIRASKSQEALKRKERCKDLLTGNLRKANIYLNGKKMDIREKEPGERINDAFKDCIEIYYNKLNYITKPFNTLDDLKRVISSDSSSQTIMEGIGLEDDNALALDEMLKFVEINSLRNIQTTVKTLMEHYNKIPYGWKDMDIQGIILTLFKKQSIKLEFGGGVLSKGDSNLLNYVTKRDYLDRTLVKIRNKVGTAVLASTKNLIKELFSTFNMPNDEEGLMAKFKELSEKELNEVEFNINDMLREYKGNRYPGQDILLSGKALFEELIKVNNVEDFYDLLEDKKDELLNYEEDSVDIRKFFKSQRDIFDKAIKMVEIYESNGSYVDDAKINEIFGDIKKIVCMDKPYGNINKLPELSKAFEDKFSQLLERECEPIKRDVKNDFIAVRDEFDRLELIDKFAKKIDDGFNNLINRLDEVNKIPEAISIREESRRLKVYFLQKLGEEQREKVLAQKKRNDLASETENEYNATEKEKVNFVVKQFKLIDPKDLFTGITEFSSLEDIERILDDLREKLKGELEENYIIKIV